MTTADANVVEIEGLRTRLVVGMEIHVELATRTKMWTAAPNVAHPDYYEAEPNSIIDPIVIGMPGTLPVMNRQAVAMSIKVGLALGCRIADWCKWDRKSYYYPDLPKNYQISQYDLPLCGEGAIDVPVSDEPGAPIKTVRITRAHLEEDAGKLLHEGPGGRPIDYSIVDLNRAGTPLLEIVTEPDIASADQAVMFGQTLRDICRFLGVTEGVMQRGHMRFEPNINVIIERDGNEYATPVVEIKNLNSFRAVHGAITHEHTRQVRQWLEDGKVMGAGAKSTRGWDDSKLVTVLQREKEDAHDYRYFPDPDLVPVEVSGQWLSDLRSEIPELPLSRQARYVGEMGIDDNDAKFLTGDRPVAEYFESLIAEGVDPVRASKLIRNRLSQLANDANRSLAELISHYTTDDSANALSPDRVKQIETLRQSDKVSSSSADTLYALILNEPNESVDALVTKHDLLQVSDASELDAWVFAAIEAEPQAADDVRNGKMAAIGRLVGAVMKLSKGQANPKAVQQKLRESLGG